MDKNLHHNIEDLFKKKLDDIEGNPSDNVWQQIETTLDKDFTTSIQKKYRSVKKVAVVLLLLLLSVGVFELQKVFKPNKNNTAASANEGVVTDHAIPGTRERSMKNTTRQQHVTKGYTGIENSGMVEPPQKNDDNKLQETATRNAASKNKVIIKPGLSVTKIKVAQPGTAIYEEGNVAADPTEINWNLITANEKIVHTTSLGKPAMPVLLAQTIPLLKITDEKSNASKTKKANHRLPISFSITPFFSPDFAWYRLQQENAATPPGISAAVLERNEKHGFSYTGGIMADVNIGKRWSLQAGVSYSDSKITIEPSILYAQPDDNGKIKFRINTSAGYGYLLPSFSNSPSVGDSIYTFATLHTLQYISVPLCIKYNILKGRFTISPTVGFAPGFLMNGKIETNVMKGSNIESQTVDNLQGLRKMYLNGILGMGVSYKINDRIDVNFNPNIKLALNSINQQVPLKSYPNSVSLALGLKINL